MESKFYVQFTIYCEILIKNWQMPTWVGVRPDGGDDDVKFS